MVIINKCVFCRCQAVFKCTFTDCYNCVRNCDVLNSAVIHECSCTNCDKSALDFSSFILKWECCDAVIEIFIVCINCTISNSSNCLPTISTIIEMNWQIKDFRIKFGWNICESVCSWNKAKCHCSNVIINSCNCRFVCNCRNIISCVISISNDCVSTSNVNWSPAIFIACKQDFINLCATTKGIWFNVANIVSKFNKCKAWTSAECKAWNCVNTCPNCKPNNTWTTCKSRFAKIWNIVMQVDVC